jgi:hypothetical protein
VHDDISQVQVVGGGGGGVNQFVQNSKHDLSPTDEAEQGTNEQWALDHVILQCQGDGQSN